MRDVLELTDPTCKTCGNTLAWKKPYVKGEPPVNTDGTSHRCEQPVATKPTESARPKVTPIEILGEIAVFYELYKDVDPAKFESMAKIYISRNMAR